MLDISEIQELDFFKDLKLLELKLLNNQGLCNTNYLLYSKKKTYLLRELNTKISINRKNEFFHQNLAYENNLAAKAYFLSSNADLMLCDYIEGVHKETLSKKDMSSLVLCLSTLHSINLRSNAVDLQNEYKNYNKECLNKETISKLDFYFSAIKDYSSELVFCHNDLNQGNILFNKEVKLIDWEYSCVNDKYFDLANVIIEYDFNKKEEESFLKQYFKNKQSCNKNKLYLFKILYLALSLLWFNAYNQKSKRDIFIKKILSLLKNEF